MKEPPKNRPKFCDGCCVRRNCNHDLEKCCYMVGNRCCVDDYR